ATETRSSNEAEKAKIEQRRDERIFTPTTEEMVQTARETVTAAEKAAQTECGNGDRKQRGKLCHEREADERKARDVLKVALEQRALTVADEKDERRLAELNTALDKPEGVQDADTIKHGGSLALARLFRVPTSWADLIADWKM